MKEVALLLHNIRSSHNVGSIFRTADAAGVARIYLSGYTPRPIDRFGRPQKEIAKTALGAERFTSWEYQTSPMRCIAHLKKDGWYIVGVEQDAKASDYRSIAYPSKVLFVFGNEIRGISKDVREKCDALVEIPMHGVMVRDARHSRHSGRGKESLNVSVTAGIVLFSCIST